MLLTTIPFIGAPRIFLGGVGADPEDIYIVSV